MAFRKWARLAIALAGVGLAVMVYVQLHRRHPAPAPLPQTSTTGGADYVGTGGEQVRLRDNKESSIQGYDKVTHFADGRTLTEKPRIVFERNDRKFTITGDQGESRTAPGDDVATPPRAITLKGHVHLTSSDGFDLTCATATYDEATGMVNVPGHTAFSRGRMRGSGQGATYDHGTDTLVLLDRAQIDTKADPQGQGVLHATARTLTLARPAHTVDLVDHAVIIRDGETMRTDRAMVALTDDDQRVTRMELRDQSSVVQPATSTEAAMKMVAREIDLDFVPENSRMRATDLRGGASVTQPPTAKSKPPQMSAETIHVEFQTDGRAAKQAVLTDRSVLKLIGTDNAERKVEGHGITVSLSTDGQRATALSAQGAVVVTLPESADTPGRTIRAETLDASGTDAAGLTSADFKPLADEKNGAVSLIETQKADPKTKRKAMSRDLEAHEMHLTLNGDLGAIEDATFNENFGFKSDDGTRASAAEGRFIEASGILRLVCSPTVHAGQPCVETDLMDVTADRIDLETKNNNLTAIKGVQSHLKPDASKTDKATTGLFDGAQKITATSDEKLVYVDETSQAVYSGSAHVWQGKNDVKAEAVTLSSRTGNIAAGGGVTTIFLLDNSPGASDAVQPGSNGFGTTACMPGGSCINAKSMNYDDATRVATYMTDATFIGSGGTAMAADKLTLTLAPEGRALDTFGADGANGSVLANFSNDHQAQGNHLTYTAATDSYVVTGKSLVIVRRSVDKGKESCSISIGQTLHYTPANDAVKRQEVWDARDDAGRRMNDGPAPSCAAIKVIK